MIASITTSGFVTVTFTSSPVPGCVFPAFVATVPDTLASAASVSVGAPIWMLSRKPAAVHDVKFPCTTVARISDEAGSRSCASALSTAASDHKSDVARPPSPTASTKRQRRDDINAGLQPRTELHLEGPHLKKH